MRRTFLIAKTTDGGATWKILTGPGAFEEDEVEGIFFLDELTGFARLQSKKLHMTTDGGETWRGIVASPGEAIQFVDPSAGWGIELGYTDLRFSYTADGGKRWTSRETKLPATIRGFSLPRRDRGYIVGDHGMIFRYSVVPAAHPAGPNDRTGGFEPAPAAATSTPPNAMMSPTSGSGSAAKNVARGGERRGEERGKRLQ